MKDKLNSGMVKISHWFRMNKLSLNFEKSKFMIIGSSRNLNNLTFISIEIQGPDIKHADHFKYLGATISSTLTCLILLVILNFFKDQPTSSLLTRIKHLLPRHAQLHFYNSLVIPIFDYADIIWGDKNNTVLMENLQVLQNKAAKIILDRPLHSSASDARGCFGWLDLAQRRRFHRWLFVYKSVNGLRSYQIKMFMDITLVTKAISNYQL